MLASQGQVLSQRGRRDADRVRDADVRQLTSLAQAVGDCAADAQSGCDFLDREKRFARQLGSLGAVAGDTGATNLASQVVASRGLSSLACRSPFRISRACDAVTRRLTRGMPPPLSSRGDGHGDRATITKVRRRRFISSRVEWRRGMRRERTGLMRRADPTGRRARAARRDPLSGDSLQRAERGRRRKRGQRDCAQSWQGQRPAREAGRKPSRHSGNLRCSSPVPWSGPVRAPRIFSASPCTRSGSTRAGIS
jgi:hypothetical protein